MRLRSITSTFTVLVVLTAASEARATEVPPKTSLPELFDEGHRWLVTMVAGTRSVSTAERPVVRAPPPVEPLFDPSPHASLVARDWRGSVKIAGGQRTMILDEIRPTASSRMLIGRVSTGARLTTFAQLGMGEWRIDTVMFPYARSYVELAGQIGIGFDVQLARSVRVGAEGQYTFLFRDQVYTPDEVAPRIFAGVVAFKATF